jgi:hypothetical protein
VTTPVTRAAFDEPFDVAPEDVLAPVDAFLPALLPLDDLDDALRPREDEADERRLDALALFGLLRELEALPRELEALLPFEDVPVLLRDALLLGLDPFELRELVFLLLCDRELVWAISPP